MDTKSQLRTNRTGKSKDNGVKKKEHASTENTESNNDGNIVNFYNNLQIFIHLYYKLMNIDEIYKWCLDSIDELPLYTVIRILNSGILLYRLIEKDIDAILTNRYYSTMMKVMQKFYNINHQSINKDNILAISKDIMNENRFTNPRTITFPEHKKVVYYKIDMQSNNYIFTVLKQFKSAFYTNSILQ